MAGTASAVKLPDGRFPSAPQRREIDRTVRIAASAFDFQIPESGIQRVTNRRGGLCGAAVALAVGSIMSAVLLIAEFAGMIRRSAKCQHATSISARAAAESRSG